MGGSSPSYDCDDDHDFEQKNYGQIHRYRQPSNCRLDCHSRYGCGRGRYGGYIVILKK
jgi:hypothetical protein